MRRWGLAVVLLAALLASPEVRAAEPPPPAAMDPLLTTALAGAAPDDEIVAIANLDAPATASQVDALRAVAGNVLAYPRLPMVAVLGTPAQLREVAEVPAVRSLYWNEAQELHTADSQNMIGAPQVWEDLGLTGEGVGIAILDSGVDATHPDLADHVVENVKIIGPEYLSQPGITFDHIILEGQRNTDTTSGHGTHVAGDAAGDGTASDGKFRGPAFDADIIGIGAGEGLSIYTALAGFDWAIAHQAEHNIRVINNSWGTSFRLHDPEHPVVRAAKAASDAGMTVVFSAGNRTAEMTLSPYAAPWTVTVAAGSKAGGLASFSSKGIEFDNLPAMASPDQVDFVSTEPPLDGVGRYHPSLTGIGEDVASARAAATVVSALGAVSGDETLSPTELPYYTHASGTSMSAPQVAGVIALAQQAFHQADPEGRWLTPSQAKAVIQLGTRPMDGLKLFQQGYGLVNAPDTVALAASLAGSTTADIDAFLAAELAERNQVVAAQRGAEILVSYAWRRPTMDAALGLAKQTFSLEVDPAADRVKAVIGFPPSSQLNVNSVDLYLFDAAGTEVGRATSSSFSHGVQVLDVTLSSLASPPQFGTWRLEARADISSNCTPGSTRCVTGNPYDSWVAAHVLDTGSVTGPTFQPTGTMTLHFHNESEGMPPPPGLVKPGYRWDGGLPGGELDARPPDTPRAGLFGYATTYAPATSKPAVFTSAPLAGDVTVGDGLNLNLYLHNEPNAVGRGSLGYWLYELDAQGNRRLVSSEELTTAATAGVTAPMAISPRFRLALPYTFSAGSRIVLELKLSAATSSSTRFYYDSPDEPAALVLTTGTVS